MPLQRHQGAATAPKPPAAGVGRTCLHGPCGRPYEPAKANQRYCSPACKQAAFEARKPRVSSAELDRLRGRVRFLARELEQVLKELQALGG